MKVAEFLGEKVIYDNSGTFILGIDKDNKEQLIADVRGWGAIQNMFPSEDLAAKFQDELGEWIADAINQKLARERSK